MGHSAPMFHFAYGIVPDLRKGERLIEFSKVDRMNVVSRTALGQLLKVCRAVFIIKTIHHTSNE